LCKGNLLGLVKNQPVENVKGAVELFEGVVHLRWTSGAFVVEEDALAVMAKASALCPGPCSSP
jgi:hypothetical protein